MQHNLVKGSLLCGHAVVQCCHSLLDLVCGGQQLAGEEPLCLCSSHFPPLFVQHGVFVQQLDQCIQVTVAILEGSDLVPLVQQLSPGIAA